MSAVIDVDVLLEVLNTAPVERGVPAEHLTGPAGAALARRHGGTGSHDELRHLRGVRDALQEMIRGRGDPTATLQRILDDVVMTPTVTSSGIRWTLTAPDDLVLAARVAHAWSVVNEQLPGRLKVCANEECNLFLLDRTRPGTAKWCSMAACGNRMKARAHASRRRPPAR